MFSFASGSDLCAFETVNKRFNKLAVAAWSRVTYTRFGIRDGKEGWKLGVSFLRKPIFINLSTETNNQFGSPQVAAHNSLIAIVTNFEEDIWTGQDVRQGINVYDAINLSHVGSLDGSGWDITIAGPPGREVFITNTDDRLVLSYSVNDDEHDMSNTFDEVQKFPSSSIDGITVIASETHVIFVTGNFINVNRISTSQHHECCALSQSILLEEGKQFTSDQYSNTIAWGPDQSTEFAVYYSSPEKNELSNWSVDTETDQISRTNTIQVDTDLELNQVALSSDYIIGASIDKKIHVWERFSGEKKHSFLCDVIDGLDADDVGHPLRMSCHGNILIATSHLGCALCVWDIEKGELLRKCYESFEERFASMLPDGMDATGMAYCKQQNGYICAHGHNQYLNIWLFPTNQEQYDQAIKIRNREANLRLQQNYDGGQDEVMDDTSPDIDSNMQP